jgi:hypothetical protein
MSAIVTSADIDRPAAEVFAYATAVIERIFGN